MSSSSSDIKTHSTAGGRSDDCHSRSSGHHRKRARKDAISSPLDDLSGKDGPYEHESSEPDDRALPRPLYVLSQQCHVTEEHEGEIVALFQETQPEIPPLLAMMTKPNVKPYPDLIIPKDYALAYFPHKSQTITLQLLGQSKKWHCEFCVRSDGGRCSLYECDFVRDNNLLEGDMCLFQPIKKAEGRTFEVMVHLLRKAGEETGHEEHGISEKSPNHDDTSRTCDLPYMKSQLTRLTKVQEMKVLEKVGAIASELPIYVALMTKTNIRVSLTFAKKYAVPYLRKGSRGLLLQVEGKSQTWHVGIDDNDRALRITGAWAYFTIDNHVREGDICLFELMKSEGPVKMMVHIIRREDC